MSAVNGELEHCPPRLVTCPPPAQRRNHSAQTSRQLLHVSSAPVRHTHAGVTTEPPSIHPGQTHPSRSRHRAHSPGKAAIELTAQAELPLSSGPGALPPPTHHPISAGSPCAVPLSVCRLGYMYMISCSLMPVRDSLSSCPSVSSGGEEVDCSRPAVGVSLPTQLVCSCSPSWQG